MSGRATLSDVAGSHPIECKVNEGLTLVRPPNLEALSVRSSNHLTPAVVRANLANHILTPHGSSTVPVLVRAPATNTSLPAAHAAVIVSSTSGSTASHVTLSMAGHTLRLPAAAASMSVDGRPASSLGMVCIMPVTGLRPAVPIQLNRLPVTADIRLPLHTLSAPRATVVERAKIVTTATALTRPAVVVHAPTGNSLADGPMGGMRALLPGQARPVSAVIKTPVGSLSGVPSWSGPGASATTVQINFRSPLDSVIGPRMAASTHLPASVQQHVLGHTQRNVLTTVTVSDTINRPAELRPIYKQQRAQLILPTSNITPTYAQLSALSSGTSQTQPVNLVTKPKVLLQPNTLQQKPGLMVSHSSLSSTGSQPLARSQVSLMTSLSSISNALTAVPSKSGVNAGAIPTVISSAPTVVTIARPPSGQHHSPIMHIAQSRPKTTTTVLPTPAIQLQGPGHGGALLLGSNLLPAGTMLSVEHFANRNQQQTDRAVPMIQRDYTAHILTVPGIRTTFEQPHVAPFGVVGQPSRQTLVASVQSSTAIAASTQIAGSSVAAGSKLTQVIVSVPAPIAPFVIDGSTAIGQVSSSAQHQHNPPTSEPTSSANQTLMSPRPSILRKRPHDVTTPKKMNLLNVLNAAGDSSGSVSSASSVTALVQCSPLKPLDVSRDNSQSSTDTASCSGSTQGSCPPSAEKIKQEVVETVENGVVTNGHVDIPRKKPRKQSLHANEEMPAPGFLSSGEDEDERAEAERQAARLKLQKQLEKAAEDAFQEEVGEYCDEDGIRFTFEDNRHRFPGGMVGSFHCPWKSRNNHFVSHNDVIVKEERRSTVNELANSRRVNQLVSGWPLYHFSDQFEQLRLLEHDSLENLKATLPHGGVDKNRYSTTAGSVDDGGVHVISELVLGNMQRCQQLIDRLDEAKSAMLSITATHKQRIIDIVARHQSKRTVKKKERL